MSGSETVHVLNFYFVPKTDIHSGTICKCTTHASEFLVENTGPLLFHVISKKYLTCKERCYITGRSFQQVKLEDDPFSEDEQCWVDDQVEEV